MFEQISRVPSFHKHAETSSQAFPDVVPTQRHRNQVLGLKLPHFNSSIYLFDSRLASHSLLNGHHGPSLHPSSRPHLARFRSLLAPTTEVEIGARSSMVNSFGVIQMEMTQCMVVTTSLERTMEWVLGRLGREGTQGMS